MKKQKSPTRSSAAKRTANTVEEYLASVPQPARATLEAVRAAIRAAAPKSATEVVSYGMPAFKDNKVLVWYAAFSNHCSFFPTAAVIEQFKNKLKGYPISKGTIQFPTDKPLPAALVKMMVKARLAQTAISGSR